MYISVNPCFTIQKWGLMGSKLYRATPFAQEHLYWIMVQLLAYATRRMLSRGQNFSSLPSVSRRQYFQRNNPVISAYGLVWPSWVILQIYCKASTPVHPSPPPFSHIDKWRIVHILSWIFFCTRYMLIINVQTVLYKRTAQPEQFGI